MEIKKIAEAVGEYLMPQLKDISYRLSTVEARQVEMSKRLDDLSRGQQIIHSRLDNMDRRLDYMNQRIDSIYQVIVRRDEHDKLEERVRILEGKIAIP